MTNIFNQQYLVDFVFPYKLLIFPPSCPDYPSCRYNHGTFAFCLIWFHIILGRYISIQSGQTANSCCSKYGNCLRRSCCQQRRIAGIINKMNFTTVTQRVNLRCGSHFSHPLAFYKSRFLFFGIDETKFRRFCQYLKTGLTYFVCIPFSSLASSRIISQAKGRNSVDSAMEET